MSSKSLLKILSTKLTRVSRGKTFDSLLKLLDEIQKKHSFLKHGIENSNDLIITKSFDKNIYKLSIFEMHINKQLAKYIQYVCTHII